VRRTISELASDWLVLTPDIVFLPCFYGIRLWIWPEPLIAPRVRRALGTRMCVARVTNLVPMALCARSTLSLVSLGLLVRLFRVDVTEIKSVHRGLGTSLEYPVNSTKTGTLTPMIKGAAVTMSGYFTKMYYIKKLNHMTELQILKYTL
jgi:hypothetical protein